MDQNAYAAFILGLLLVGSGLVLLWVGWLGGQGRLTRQNIAGIRTRATLASDEAWNAAHRAGAPWLLAGGVAALLGGLVDLLLSVTTAGLVFWVTGLTGLLVVGFVTVAGVVGQGAARAAGG